MTTLADINTEDWTPVAYRIRATSKTDGWKWLLPPEEIPILKGAEGRTIIVTHRHSSYGVERVARLVRGGQGPGPDAFALAGRGLFKQ